MSGWGQDVVFRAKCSAVARRPRGFGLNRGRTSPQLLAAFPNEPPGLGRPFVTMGASHLFGYDHINMHPCPPPPLLTAPRAMRARGPP